MVKTGRAALGRLRFVGCSVSLDSASRCVDDRHSSATRSATNTFSNECQGTSRLLARAFKLLSNGAGSRNENVSVDGFRFGSDTMVAGDQSTEPAKSCVSQRWRSSASEANLGIG